MKLTASKILSGIQTFLNHKNVNPDPESFRLDGSDPDQTFIDEKKYKSGNFAK